MPRSLALTIFIGFILWLFKRDLKANPEVSKALWIPLIWVLIAGSRSLKEWVYGLIPDMGGASASFQSSSLDRNVIFLLMILAIVVLSKRSWSLSSAMMSNGALFLFFAYTLLSLIWSESPMAAFSQWYRMIGNVLMAFVVCTEPEPMKALKALLRRSSYVLVVGSVLFIKYYPEWGRTFSSWNGWAQNIGIANSKNKLGELCMVFGLFFLSSLAAGWKGRNGLSRTDRNIFLLLLAMDGWLLFRANTSTALVATVVSAAVIIALQNSTIRQSFTWLTVIACLVGVFLLEFTNLKDTIILALGEDTTLTGRTELWADLAAVPVNPIVGAGFESFWLGTSGAIVQNKYWWHPNQAHNGYLELYLNLGIVGLGILFAMLLAAYFNARRQMLASWISADFAERSQFCVAFVVGFLLCNWADASFKAGAFLFLIFLIATVQYSPAREPVLSRFGAAQVRVRPLAR